MLKTKNPVFRIVLIIILLCLIGCIIFGVQTAVSPQTDIYMQISSLCALPAMIFAAYYMLAGYSKGSAGYFKFFLFLFAIYLLSVLVADIAQGRVSGIVLTALSLAVVLVMLIGKNPGKKVSLTLCVVVILVCALEVLLMCCQQPTLFSDSDPAGKLLLGRSATGGLLACLMGVITFAKYVDKEARGTK